VAFSAEVLAALASLRALEVLFHSASKEATRARASACATVNAEVTWKDQAKGKPVLEYNRRAVHGREETFRFIIIFLDLHTIRAKRQKSLHQRLQSKTV
jgi:hypothetical protein